MSFPAYSAYRDSGIDWIGVLPVTWSLARAKSLFSIVNGATPKSDVPEYWDGDIPWITPADLSGRPSWLIENSMRTITTLGLESCGTTRVPEGSIILSTRAPIGSLGLAVVPLCTNQGCKALVPSPRALARFFLYALAACQIQLNVQGKGTTFLELSSDALGSFKLPLPSLAEQSAIAAFLDRETGKIDALVAEQERLIALLKEKRQAVISQAVTKGLDPNAPMKDSGVEWLGEVPAHWEVEPLKRFLREPLMYGANQASDDDTPGNPRFVRITDVADDGSLRDETFRSLPPAVAAPYILADGDILLARSGATVGKSFKYRDSWGICCFAGYLIRARFDTQRLTPDFADYLCASKLYWAYVQAEQIQATIPNVSAERYGAMLLPCPPTGEQARICSYLNGETGKIDTLTAEAQGAIALLKERRAALISAAVTGKIDVRGLVTPEEVQAA